MAIGGKVATDIFEGERRFQAVVRLPESMRDSIEEIRKITLTTRGGALVPLDNLARIEVSEGPAQISRETGKRRIVVGDQRAGPRPRRLRRRVAQQGRGAGQAAGGLLLRMGRHSSRTWSAR